MSEGVIERYECTRCGSDIFHAIVTEDGLSFLRCATCDREVIPEHRDLWTGDDQEEADRDE